MTAAGAMAEKAPVVIIVDDDPSFRMFLSRLVQTVGLKSILFTSAEEFLAAPQPDGPACLVLDVQMPGLSGLDLQRELTQRGRPLPIVFTTGHGDIPMTVRAMRAASRVIGCPPELREDSTDTAADPAYISERGAGDSRYAWSRSSRLRRAWR